MWRNKESQSPSQSTPSRRAPDNTNSPEAPNKSSSPAGTTAHGGAWLSSSMKVKGQISGNEDLIVDGKVEGPVSVGEHRLIVGREGWVTGGLAAREIVIYGKVEGNQTAVSESIEIKKDALMIGNLKTRRIVIEDGAAFKGSIEIEESGKQAESKPDESTPRVLSKSAG